MKLLVIGASRGIGLEVVRQALADGDQVTATARDDAALDRLRGLGATALALDLLDAESCSRIGWQLDGASFDAVLLNAGVYGPETNGLEPPSQADFDAVMHTNVLGAMRLIPQVQDVLAPQGKLAVVSSRMGSIGSRNSSVGWLYRASKAALNSVLKDASLALGGRAICVALHPGWVQTDMGGPGASLTVAQSAADLRRLIARLQPSDNGRYLNHDGTPIDW